MSRIRTGDIVRAFRRVWPHVTGDMIRRAEQEQKLKAIRSPFSERSGLFYDPESIQNFVSQQVKQHEITADEARIILGDLGLNFLQLKLIKQIAL